MSGLTAKEIRTRAETLVSKFPDHVHIFGEDWDWGCPRCIVEATLLLLAALQRACDEINATRPVTAHLIPDDFLEEAFDGE